ncbi:MAG: phage portal protein lambda family [Caproiciproducens sp.]|jgi:lambda family phage portal protein|nr:phage portal protein lambda family [Caproiciproducens sp.]
MRASLLDKLITYVSPKAGYYRAKYQAGVNAVRNYDAGKIDRSNADWVPVNSSPEQTDANQRPFVTARARDLERNSDIAESVVDAIVRNVIGTGIKPQAQIKNDDDSFNEKLNTQLEKKFQRWAMPENCDITGHQSFYELQTMALTRRIYDGEIFALPIMMKDKALFLPLQLQLIEPDLLATGLINAPGTNNVILHGVEVNKYFKPLAYWFQEMSPDGYTSLEARRVPANKVWHLFKKRRPNQTRGMSELHRIMNRLKETGRYLDAELLCREIAACFAAYVETDLPTEQVSTLRKGDKEKPQKDLVPGTVTYLSPGEKITTAQPPASGASVQDYTQVELRLAGAGIGVSYEEVSRDMSKSTYSSARMAHLADRRTFIPIQNYVIVHFCRPVWREFVRSCVLTNQVKIPDYWQNEEKYLECNWIAPGWAWIDPLKDVKATREEIDAGLATVADKCAERGDDWRDVYMQLKREQDYAKELGLNINILANKGGITQSATAEQQNTNVGNKP